MKDSDTAEFDAVLSRLFRTMGKPVPRADVKRIWWAVFENCELEEFAEACSQFIRHEDRFPVPASVKRYLPRRVGAQVIWTHDRLLPGTGGMRRAAYLLRDCRRRLEDSRGQAKKDPAAD